MALLVAAGVGGALVYLCYSRSTAPPAPSVRKKPKKDSAATYYEVRNPIAPLQDVLLGPSVRNRDFQFLGKERGVGGSVRYKYYLPTSHCVTYSAIPLDTFQNSA